MEFINLWMLFNCIPTTAIKLVSNPSSQPVDSRCPCPSWTWKSLPVDNRVGESRIKRKCSAWTKVLISKKIVFFSFLFFSNKIIMCHGRAVYYKFYAWDCLAKFCFGRVVAEQFKPLNPSSGVVTSSVVATVGGGGRAHPALTISARHFSCKLDCRPPQNFPQN